jgi:RHS repeat-associated protein
MVTTDTAVSDERYTPWGTARDASQQAAVPYRYTGQREEAALGLYDYGARWYDPAVGRFIQADTIVPEPGNPQSLNRYSYALNNPMRYTDPDGVSPHRYFYLISPCLIPRQFDGTNDFENLVPLRKGFHQGSFNAWWNNYREGIKYV